MLFNGFKDPLNTQKYTEISLECTHLLCLFFKQMGKHQDIGCTIEPENSRFSGVSSVDYGY